MEKLQDMNEFDLLGKDDEINMQIDMINGEYKRLAENIEDY